MKPDEQKQTPDPEMDQSTNAPTPGETAPPAHQPDDLDNVQQQMRSQEDADRQERIDYLKRMAGPRKPKKTWVKWVLIGLAVVLIALAAVYFLVLKPKSEDKNTKQSTGSAQQTPTTQEEPTTITTKHHQSNNFALEFDYPDDWTVTDDGTGKLTVKSPTMPLKSASGKTVNGQVTLTIQGKQAELKEFKNGNGLAVRESDKLTYTKPTQSQRAQTYLSFVSYAGATTIGIDGMYITGDIGYQKDQAVPMVDIVRVDPLITVSFTGENGASLTIATDSWNDANKMTKSIKTILTSLSIQ